MAYIFLLVNTFPEMISQFCIDFFFTTQLLLLVVEEHLFFSQCFYIFSLLYKPYIIIIIM